jgi:hypothetical protein
MTGYSRELTDPKSAVRKCPRKGKLNRVFSFRSNEPFRWRLELRQRRMSLESTPVEPPARSYYRNSNHFWTDALRNSMSAYDFADVLAVHLAMTEPPGGGPRLTGLRQQIFAALQEAANEGVAWFIDERGTPIRGQVGSETDCDATYMTASLLVPVEAAAWLRQRPETASLIPECLHEYLTRSGRAAAQHSGIVGMHELEAYMSQPEIMSRTRPEQWRIVREHFQPRWVLRDYFRRAAAMNPRSAGRTPPRWVHPGL